MPIKSVPKTKADWLVQIGNLSKAYWPNFSGLSDSTGTTEYSDGFRRRLYKLNGPRNVENVTMTKPYNPNEDVALIQWWLAWCNAQGTEETITVQPVTYCPDPEPDGSAITFLGCRPASLKVAEVDKTSSDISTIELTFSVDDYSVGGANVAGASGNILTSALGAIGIG